jgi:hypothetical protein
MQEVISAVFEELKIALIATPIIIVAAIVMAALASWLLEKK